MYLRTLIPIVCRTNATGQEKLFTGYEQLNYSISLRLSHKL